MRDHLRRDAATGITQLEDYLLWHSGLRQARSQAAHLASRMPWLTEVERVELAAICERVVEAAGDGCREAEARYAARYRELRQRLLCVLGCALTACAGLAVALVVVLTG